MSARRLQWPTLRVGIDPDELGVLLQLAYQSFWGHRFVFQLKIGGVFVIVSWVIPPKRRLTIHPDGHVEEVEL